MLICLMVLSLSYCGKSTESDASQTVIENTDVCDTFGSTIDTETEPPIGGGFNGYDVDSIYGFFDGIEFIPNTFAMWDDTTKYIDEFDKSDWFSDADRPCLMYFLVHKLNLTRDDLETYFTVQGSAEYMTEDYYRGLLTDNLSESMQLLKTKYAFYRDGALYTFYDIREMSENDAKVFTEGTEYADVWENILECMKQSTMMLYDEKNIAFVEKAVRNTEVKE